MTLVPFPMAPLRSRPTPSSGIRFTEQYQTSAWVTKSFTFENQTDVAPVLTSFGLAAPISEGSTTTNTPEISGRVTNEYTLSGVKIEIDTDNDGVADQATYTDSLGKYSILANVAPGSNSVKIRTSEVALNGSILTSTWRQRSWSGCSQHSQRCSGYWNRYCEPPSHRHQWYCLG